MNAQLIAIAVAMEQAANDLVPGAAATHEIIAGWAREVRAIAGQRPPGHGAGYASPAITGGSADGGAWNPRVNRPRQIRTTHTYVILKISAAAHAEIRGALVEANYDHAISSDGTQEVIDMHGIAVAAAVDPVRAYWAEQKRRETEANQAPCFERVDSTNVWAFAYTPNDQTLHVQFKSGGSYTYRPFAPERVEEFRQTPSKGGFIAKLQKEPNVKAQFVENWQDAIRLANAGGL